MARCTRRCGATACGVSLVVLGGIVLAGLGWVAPSLLQTALEEGIRKQIVVDSAEAPSFKGFEDDATAGSIPIYFEVYVFNCTNAENFQAGVDAKPVLEQLGPYIYRELQQNVRSTFPDGGNRIKFVPWEYYVFDEAKSAGRNPFTDKITTASLPLAGVRHGLGSSWLAQLGVSTLSSASKASIFTRKTVHELLWGYEVPLLELVAKLQPGTPTEFGLQVNLTTPEEALEKHGYDEKMTGKDSLAHIKQFTLWSNKSSLDYWATSEANKVQGFDALQFPPGVTHGDSTYSVFVDSLFRTADIVTSKESTTTVHDIDLQVFKLDKKQMENASTVPANAVYYLFGRSGVVNLTAPTGAPVFMSKPHFLDADPWYREKVVGMEPNAELHDTIICVEPISGATMEAYKRLQVNVKLEPLFLLADSMEEVYLPVAWFQEGSQINEELAKKFRESVYGVLKDQKIFRYVGWIAGPVLLLLGLCLAGYAIFRMKSPWRHSVAMYRPINRSLTDDETMFDEPSR